MRNRRRDTLKEMRRKGTREKNGRKTKDDTIILYKFFMRNERRKDQKRKKRWKREREKEIEKKEEICEGGERRMGRK